MHYPIGTSNLEVSEREQIRLLLQGMYGTGKTFAATTAPNPVFLNFDRGLGAHAGRKDIINVPFYDINYIKKFSPQGLRHIALTEWITKEASQLTREQTLVIDGLTSISTYWDKEVSVPYSTKTGKEDSQAWWGLKLDWNKELFESFKSLKCDVILLCHEQPEYEDGGVTGKVLPLIQGSFKGQIGNHFSDLFRQHAVSKPDVDKLSADALAKTLVNMKMTKEQYLKFIDSFETNTMYLWQLTPDSIVNCKTHLTNPAKFCKASWNIFSA